MHSQNHPQQLLLSFFEANVACVDVHDRQASSPQMAWSRSTSPFRVVVADFICHVCEEENVLNVFDRRWRSRLFLKGWPPYHHPFFEALVLDSKEEEKKLYKSLSVSGTRPAGGECWCWCFSLSSPIFWACFPTLRVQRVHPPNLSSVVFP